MHARHRLLLTGRGTMVVLVLAAGIGCAPAPPPYKPVADVRQLMATVIEPAAEIYWDAVGLIMDETGTHEIEPQTAEDWDEVRNSAYVVAESGNLLMMSARARDGGDWMRYSRELIEAGERAIRAAEARDKAAVFDVGADVYETCTNCHAQYAVELMRPNAQ